MTVRKSQQKCVNKYIEGHYDRINLTVPKGKKEIIKLAADRNAESVNAFINRAIDLLLDSGGGFGIEEQSGEQNDNS